MIRKLFIYCTILVLLVTGAKGFVYGQEVPNLDFTDTEQLAEEQRMLWVIYGVDPQLLGEVSVGQANMGVEELIEALGLTEGYFDQSDLGTVLHNTLVLFADELRDTLGDDWVKMAEAKVSNLAGVPHFTYITGEAMPGLAIPEGVEIQININSPYLSPISLEVYEGTYVTFTQYHTPDTEMEGDYSESFGEEIAVDSEILPDYLVGEWTIEWGDLEVPDVTITIGQPVGSVDETEIEAKRLLFGGQIQIGEMIYQAYAELDGENMYAYPMRVISVLQEEGEAARLEIFVEDYEENISLWITTDLDEIYERAVAINLDYDIKDSYGQQEENYLVRK